MARFKKSDVEFHSYLPYGGPPILPAVNVKNYQSVQDVKLPIDLGRYSDDGGQTWQTAVTHPGYTYEWVENYLSEDFDNISWAWACELAWEDLQDTANYIFTENVRVEAVGRSGGWAVVHGLKDFESWNAIDLSRWARFAKCARLNTDDLMRVCLENIYCNVYEPDITPNPEEVEAARQSLIVLEAQLRP